MNKTFDQLKGEEVAQARAGALALIVAGAYLAIAPRQARLWSCSPVRASSFC